MELFQQHPRPQLLLRFLIDWLEGVADGTVEWRRTDKGICEALGRLTDYEFACEQIPDWYIKEWEHYSGNVIFPLPGGLNAYCDYANRPLAGEYGEYRREYAQYLADYLKHFLKRRKKL